MESSALFTPDHDVALHELLAAWTARDELRRTNAAIPDRFAANQRLDNARLQLAPLSRFAVAA